MAQNDQSPKTVSACEEVTSNLTSSELTLPEKAAAAFVLGAPPGSVFALAGIASTTLRTQIDNIEPEQCDKRVLFAPIQSAPTTEVVVEQVINLFAETARCLWPVWFTNVSFDACGNDTLGRRAVNAIARNAAAQIIGLSIGWTDAAARLVLENRLPRVSGALPATELTQLALAISGSGLILLADADAAVRAASNSAAIVHALEWIAQHSHAAVVTLFAELPPNEPPFDRILFGARRVTTQVHPEPRAGELATTRAEEAGPWIAPWRGRPHPLSDVEQRLYSVLTADNELATLFHFNLPIDTVRGSRPRVDLVWPQGRLVVELDGYGSHGNRSAFIYDRQRDYELALSGYVVLRLANDEIAQDFGKAIEKIRDLVRLRKTQIREES
jgi:very-short-patch-repair endonuclease